MSIELYLKAAIDVAQDVQKRQYEGYDPYDALSSPSLSRLAFDNAMIKRVFLHTVRSCPINLRPILGIKKRRNTTAMALFTLSFLNLYRLTGNFRYLDLVNETAQWLESKAVRTGSGFGWGRTTEFQTATVSHGKGEPLTFLTALVGKVMVKMFEFSNELKYLDMAIRACNWILNNSHIHETADGICFCYTSNPSSQRIFNASAMAASLLAMVYRYSGDKHFKEFAESSMNYILKEQEPEGYWIYGYDHKGKRLVQIDFHQGFILDCIVGFIKYTGGEEKYLKSLKKGAKFYMQKQFTEQGVALWRFPSKWPIDIHNQAQGVITFSRTAHLSENYLNFARKILLWTMDNLYNGNGIFFYQKYPFFTNRIAFIRWCQAWGLFALTTYLVCEKEFR